MWTKVHKTNSMISLLQFLFIFWGNLTKKNTCNSKQNLCVNETSQTIAQKKTNEMKKIEQKTTVTRSPPKKFFSITCEVALLISIPKIQNKHWTALTDLQPKTKVLRKIQNLRTNFNFCFWKVWKSKFRNKKFSKKKCFSSNFFNNYMFTKITKSDKSPELRSNLCVKKISKRKI